MPFIFKLIKRFYHFKIVAKNRDEIGTVITELCPFENCYIYLVWKSNQVKIEIGGNEALSGSDVTRSTKRAVNMERSEEIERLSDDSVSVMSAGSSSFDDSSTEDFGLGVQPYLFEPEIDSDEELPAPQSPDHADDHSERMGNNDW